MTHLGQVLGLDARVGIAWRISSYSPNGGGSCVEAGALPDATGRVAVRHSHHPDGLALVIGQRTWTIFIDGVQNDKFDLPPFFRSGSRQRLALPAALHAE